MNRIVAAAIAAAVLVAPHVATAEGASGLKVIDHIAGPDGGWDYASFDAARRRVYIAHGQSVVAIEVDSGKVIPNFAAGDHLHAVVPVPGLDRLVTTNSGDQTVKVISSADGKLIASIPVAKDPDSAIYDPHTRTVVVIGGDSGTVTLIDPKKATKVAEIPVGGDLEFAVVDGKGRLWINAADTHEIVALDLDTRKVTGRYPMTGCVRPTGLAYVAGGRLVSSCQTVAKILDAATGKDIATLPIGVGPDAVIYDESRGLAYIPSGRAGALAVIALRGPRDNTVVDTVPTKVGARTGTVDTKTGKVYLPAADYLPPVAGQRPATKPGSFQVLVLGR